MFFLQILLNSIVHSTQILLVAVPLYLIYSVSGVFHLAVGAISTAVAYGFYKAYVSTGSVVIAIAVSSAIAVACATLSYFLLEPYIQKKQNMLALLVSFSAGTAIESILSMSFGSDGKNITEGVLPVFHILGLNLTLAGFVTVLSGLFFVMISAILVKMTRFGRVLRSLSENRTSAESMGTDSRKMRFVTYAIAIFMAGFVGIMSGLNTSITPSMGFNNVLLAFIAFLIGGTHSIVGVFIASFLVTFIPQFAVSYSDFSDAWKMVFMFVMASVVLSVRPKGLFQSNIRNS